MLSKIYEESTYPKVSSGGYSLWIAIMSVLMTAVVLAFMIKKVKMPTAKATLLAAGGGLLNRVANFLLLIALAFLPASVQYPLITGGVIAASTVISILEGHRPSKKELAALVLALLSVLVLFIEIEIYTVTF